jgi:hypothetical protein
MPSTSATLQDATRSEANGCVCPSRLVDRGTREGDDMSWSRLVRSRRARVTFVVTENGDTLYEANEAVHVRLSSPTNAVLRRSDGIGQATIVNDD